MVLISDHINLTGASPLRGATFIDLSEAYAGRLRAVAHGVDPTLPEGVYVQFGGPQFETPAEVRMAGVLGGNLVGMSTALETIAAREAGLQVLGISLVTNLAAGISGEPLNHRRCCRRGARRRHGCAAAGRHRRGPVSESPLDPDLLRRVAAWTEQDPDPQTRQRVNVLLNAATEGSDSAAAELADAFAGRLEFGTAGLRGALGPGPNRMNRVVVGQAAAALATYLLDQGSPAAG